MIYLKVQLSNSEIIRQSKFKELMDHLDKMSNQDFRFDFESSCMASLSIVPDPKEDTKRELNPAEQMAHDNVRGIKRKQRKSKK